MKSWKTLTALAVCASLGTSLSGWSVPTTAESAQGKVSQSILAQSPLNPAPIGPDAPYVPTPADVVDAMLKLAAVKEGDVVYDLGSGDGRLVIEAAQKFGAKRGVGVELEAKLVELSNQNAKQAGVGDRVQFLQQDLFKTNISEATVVTLYLLPKINIELRPKLLDELQPGTRIVSHAFDMDDWKPDKTVVVRARDRQRILYYWVIPAKVEGTWQGTLTTPSGQRQPYTLQLTQKFQQVKGVLNLNGQTLTIADAKLTGNQIRFSGNQILVGQPVKLQFEGQVRGNVLSGTAEVQNGSTSKQYSLLARRVATGAASPSP